MSRESYARINKRSSMDRWSREMDPELWDKLDARYEDPEHRVHTDEWCTTQQEHALRNFDLNNNTVATRGTSYACQNSNQTKWYAISNGELVRGGTTYYTPSVYDVTGTVNCGW
ncbi:hypothetical protein [Microbacterium maritypicum]|uniref:hypothetical protein n=1 Tax=Microbacterium maritypicum TaxID=33918 RepID=UPI003CEBE4E1